MMQERGNDASAEDISAWVEIRRRAKLFLLAFGHKHIAECGALHF